MAANVRVRKKKMSVEEAPRAERLTTLLRLASV